MPLYHTRLQPLFHLSVHSWNVVNHNLKFEHLTQKNRLLGGFSEKGGPSDRIRTCGILLPKQARYQLRYTRLLSFLSGWAYSPKPGAIPTSLYPDIQFLSLYHGGEENQRFFCLWSFLWSKPLLCRFRQPGKNRYCPCCKALRRFALPRPGYRHGTPKAGALPTALHPVIYCRLERPPP